MSFAIMQLRLDTLSRQIHKKNSRLSFLQQELDTLTTAYTNNSRLYKQCYLMANGIDSTISEEMQQTFSEQLGALEPVMLMIDAKSDKIELEISETNSELAQYNNEIKTVQKWIEDNAKKETAHYTTS